MLRTFFLVILFVTILLFVKKVPSDVAPDVPGINQETVSDNVSCNQDALGRQVISKMEKSQSETDQMSFEDVVWETYQDPELKLAFDYPIGIYALQKNTDALGVKKDVTYLLSPCTQNGTGVVSISFVFDRKTIDLNFDYLQNPHKYRPEKLPPVTVKEVVIGDQKAQMIVDNAQVPVPTDIYQINYYNPDGSVDYQVVIYTLKKDMREYYNATGRTAELDSEYLKRYESFDTKIVARFLESIRFQ
jgi:hypothetical protein